MNFYPVISDRDSDTDNSDTENNDGKGVFKLPPRLAARLQKRNEARKQTVAKRNFDPPELLTSEDTRSIFMNLTNASQKLEEHPQLLDDQSQMIMKQQETIDRRKTMLKQRLMLNRRETMLIRVKKVSFSLHKLLKTF